MHVKERELPVYPAAFVVHTRTGHAHTMAVRPAKSAFIA